MEEHVTLDEKTLTRIGHSSRVPRIDGIDQGLLKSILELFSVWVAVDIRDRWKDFGFKSFSTWLTEDTAATIAEYNDLKRIVVAIINERVSEAEIRRFYANMAEILERKQESQKAVDCKVPIMRRGKQE